MQKENRKGAAKPRPLCTPLGLFFKEFLVVDEGRVLTCVCMLGYWMWDAVPIWFLYASVLVVGCCADLVPVCFGIGCGALCRFFLICCVFLALGRMYIRFYSLLSAVEFSAGDVAAVWAAAEKV